MCLLCLISCLVRFAEDEKGTLARRRRPLLRLLADLLLLGVLQDPSPLLSVVKELVRAPAAGSSTAAGQRLALLHCARAVIAAAVVVQLAVLCCAGAGVTAAVAVQLHIWGNAPGGLS
jgi:hypothetical protein